MPKVTVCLDWTPNTNHIGFYVAAHEGLYEKAGLEAELRRPRYRDLDTPELADATELLAANAPCAMVPLKPKELTPPQKSSEWHAAPRVCVGRRGHARSDLTDERMSGLSLRSCRLPIVAT